MARAINLRQVEIFKAVIEHGTVSRAAEILRISQPAASKLLMHLEADHGLALFDRAKGRLVPTAQAMRLYGEVERIFAGLRQVETAIAVIRRESQGRLAVGVLPALAGDFIQQATRAFLRRHPDVYCSIQALNSRRVIDGVLDRKLDVGIVTSRVEAPTIQTEALLPHPLVCIMRPGHALSRRKVVRPEHLNDVAFVAFSDETHTGQMIARLFEQHNIRAKIVLTASITPTVCGFVAGGLGVSLVHPLFVAGLEHTVVARPFLPETPFDFLLCCPRDARQTPLVGAFIEETKRLAARISTKLERR